MGLLFTILSFGLLGSNDAMAVTICDETTCYVYEVRYDMEGNWWHELVNTFPCGANTCNQVY